LPVAYLEREKEIVKAGAEEARMTEEWEKAIGARKDGLGSGLRMDLFLRGTSLGGAFDPVTSLIRFA